MGQRRKVSDHQIAGWAFGIVCDGDGDEDDEAEWIGERWGGVEGEHKSNNVAELEALAQLLKWLKDEDPNHDRPVLVRTDSTYAANVARGRTTATTDLGKECKTLWQQVRIQRAGKLWWRHVKAHASNKWNERVDSLAKRGANGETGQWGVCFSHEDSEASSDDEAACDDNASAESELSQDPSPNRDEKDDSMSLGESEGELEQEDDDETSSYNEPNTRTANAGTHTWADVIKTATPSRTIPPTCHESSSTLAENKGGSQATMNTSSMEVA